MDLELCSVSDAKHNDPIFRLGFNWARDWMRHEEKVVYRPGSTVAVAGRLYFNCDVPGSGSSEAEVVASLFDAMSLSPEVRKSLLFSSAKDVAAELDCKTKPDFSDVYIDSTKANEGPSSPAPEPHDTGGQVVR